MTIEERKIELIKEIESAFSNLKLGDGLSIHQAKAIDDGCSSREIEEARSKDDYEQWIDIPRDLLIQYGPTLLAHTYDDSEGFIFHLPAMMREALISNTISLYSTCIYHLTREPINVINEYKLTNAQIKVIAKFWELDFDLTNYSIDKHYEKRLLEWLEAAEKV